MNIKSRLMLWAFYQDNSFNKEKRMINRFLKLAQLSETEIAQLGQDRPGSQYPYVKKEDWEKFREYLKEKSLKSNPKLDTELTAYTPGETVNLLNHPKIIEWFNKIKKFRIPENYKIIALVPCAKTKPWGKTRPKSSDLYNAYHEIIEKNKQGELKMAPIYFVTISEPLGIVPQDFWDDFPQYDNPGLFADPVMRSGGLFTRDYSKTPIGTKHIIPFDEKAYEEAISKLGTTIAEFIRNNTMPGRVFISFVEDPSGKIKTTHSHMLDTANIPDILPQEYRYDKPKGKTSKERIEPIQHYLSKLQEIEEKRKKL